MKNDLRIIETLTAMKDFEMKQKIEDTKITISVIKEIEISKEDFIEYINCQNSGLTNMLNISNVEMITGLSKDKIKAIIKNYNKLEEKYNREGGLKG